MATSLDAAADGLCALSPLSAYPRGGYGDSEEFEAGETRRLPLVGRELGEPLGHGGRVEEGKIHCPFHAWQF